MTNAGNEGRNFKAQLGQKPGDHLSLNVLGKGGKMNVKRFFIAALMLLPALYLHSCCLIGLGIGAISDAQKKDSLVVRPEQWTQIEQGKRIKVKLKHGRVLVGKFISFRRRAQRSYAERYNQFVRNKSIRTSLPTMYENLLIETSDKDLLYGKFLGFDSSGLFVLSNHQSCHHFDWEQVAVLMHGINPNFDLPAIRSLVLKSDFPRFTTKQIEREPTLSLLAKRTPQSFAAHEIEQVQILPRKNGKLIGFIVGAVLDVSFIAYSFYQLSHMSLNMNLGPM